MKNIFSKLWKKYCKNILIQNITYSLLITFTLTFIFGAIFYITGYSKMLHLILISFSSAAVSFIILSFINKPKENKFSKELDSLGLQERIITLNEYINENSLMAKIQRQNAINYGNKINPKLLKAEIKLSILLLIILSGILSVGMITVNALAKENKIDSFDEIVEETYNINSYEITYTTNGEGFIDGDIFQIIPEGDDCTAVYAEADDAWIFNSWSDGLEDPYRLDTNIKESLEITAIFEEFTYEEQDSEESEDGKPEEGNLEEELGENNYQDSDQEGKGEGGKYEENNQIIDGETYYGDNIFDNAYNDALDEITNTNLENIEKSLVEDYFNTIEK